MNKFLTSTLSHKLMRITFFQLLVIAGLCSLAQARPTVAQGVLDQRVNLRVENQRLRSTLAQLEKAAQINFMYQSKVLSSNPRISVNATNRRLGDVLTELLADLRIEYQVIGRQIVLRPSSPTAAVSSLGAPKLVRAQERQVTGRVMAQDKGAGSSEGLPGVNIAIKGTSRGTTTDVSGNYAISVPDGGSTLVFSYIGYEPQEIAIGSSSVIDVNMVPSINNLNEVVVVGYGTQQRRDVTGSISSVKSEDIKSLPVTGLDQALQGRAAGVQITQNNAEPGGSVSIRIRGVGSVNGSEPLVVVDGLPMGGSLNSINPNDIESIEILKDASAAAIYGSRAANGVVLVTTKRGKAGETRVELDTYFGVQSAARTIPVLSGPEFAMLANEAYTNSSTPANRRLNPAWANPGQLPTYDWQRAVFQNAPIYSVNLNISGGTAKSRSAVSLNYFKQDGLIVNSKYDRYSIRANNDLQATKRVKIGSSIYLARDESQVVPSNDFSFGVLSTALQMHPMQPIFAADGPQSSTVFGLDGYSHFPLATDGLYYPRQLSNPVWGTRPDVISNTRSLTRLFGTVYAEIDIMEGLKFRSSIGGDLSFSQNNNFAANVPFNVFGANVGPIRVGQGRSENGQWNWINTLSYAKTFGQKHEFTALAGTDALQGKNSGISGNAVGLPNNAIRALSFGTIDSRLVSGGDLTYSLFSYLGRVTYAYDSRYLLAFNVRQDGSSNFGPGNKYGVFPSASVGWRLSEESFLKDIKGLNELKLRASWGMLGNQNIGDYRFLNALGVRDTYSVGTGDQRGVNNTVVTNLANPNIKWEATTQIDIGLDAVLLNGKVNLTVDYYNRKTSDMLVNVPVPVMLGAPNNSIAQNAGSITNSGFEFTAGYRENEGDFKWSVDANFSTLRNRVTSLGNGGAPINRRFNEGGNNASTRTEVGQPIGYFWGLETDGIFQNQGEVDASAQKGAAMPGDRRFVDQDANGLINSADRINLGNGLPTFLLGATLKASYKNFDFSMLIQGQGGNKIANNTRRQMYDIRNFNGAGVQNVSTDMLDRWTGPGTSNTMPRVAYQTSTTTNNLFSSYYIENGAFVRCRNIQVGYTIPATLAQRIKTSSIRLYVSAQNLFTITKYSGYDPEIGSIGGNVLSTGIDQGRYPAARMFIGGLNIVF